MKNKILKLLAVLVILIFPQSSSASVSMSLSQYINEILLNNHSIRANMKNIEAEYYSVLSSVAYQRPSVSATATGAFTTAQGTANGKEYGVKAGSTGLRLTQRIDISGSYKLDEKQNILGFMVETIVATD